MTKQATICYNNIVRNQERKVRVMKEYKVEFDAVDFYCVYFYEADDYKDIMKIVKEELIEMGGGHADIFDSEDNYIGYYEI